jgi:integrase
MFSWLVEREVLDVSPLLMVKRPMKEKPRKRVLIFNGGGDAELLKIWRASDDLSHPYPQIIRLLILLAARKLEVGEMRWSELDLDLGRWVLPEERTNKCELVLPLPKQAVAILNDIPRVHGSDFVFTLDGTPVSAYARAMTALRKALPDAPHWSLHDLRRTAATGMAKRCKIAPHIIEAILNHKKGGKVSAIAAIYNLDDNYDEKRDALQKWADYVERLDGSNVVPLSGAATLAEVEEATEAAAS